MQSSKNYNRPFDHPQTKLSAGEMLLHAALMIAYRRFGWLPLPWKGFLNRCPRIFTQAVIFKLSHSSDFEGAFHSARLALEVGKRASRRRCYREAAILIVTAARLSQIAYSSYVDAYSNRICPDDLYSRIQIKQMQLQSFISLKFIQDLPTEDAGYWPTCLAEITAFLFREIAAYQYPELFDNLDVHFSVPAVADTISKYAPFTMTAEAVPLPISYGYVGGPDRVQIQLAHLELFGDRGEDALQRMELLLNKGLETLDDHIYALTVAISAARALGRLGTHDKMILALHALVDEIRTTYSSTKGRMHGMERIFHEFREALAIWNYKCLMRAEDMLAIAEILKARLLLDEMGGHLIKEEQYIPATDYPIFEEISKRFADKGEISKTMLHELLKTSGISIGPGLGNLDYLHRFRPAGLEQEDAICRLSGCGWSGTSHPSSPAEIQACLAPGELCIEFLIPRDPIAPNTDCWIIVISNDSIKMKGFYVQGNACVQEVLGSGNYIERGPISDAVALARDAILRRDTEKSTEVLQKLYRWLVEPIISMGFKPESYHRWVIIPHGPLHMLPFQALMDEDKRYLIERVALTTAPSASIWIRMQRHSLEPRYPALLAIGNPYHPGVGLSDLPDSEDEAARLPNLLPQEVDSTVLLKNSATESAVKAAMTKAGIIHFSTHGILDWRQPRNGHRILLAQSEDEDGLLRSSEVRAMKLKNLRLVVLNICDGAVCRFGSGNEPLGLMAAFIAAGAENVIGGLWELPDAASKIFMLDLYRNLAGRDLSHARQSAAINAIKKQRPPLFWAGFELLGPARTIIER